MMTAVDCLFLLVSDAPQETWGQAGTWLVPSEARAQAPICSTGVFLLTRLKLWDLEHTLGSGHQSSQALICLLGLAW